MSSRKGSIIWLALLAGAIALGVYASQVEAQIPGGSSGLAGYERVQITTPSTTSLNKSTTASCPAGKVVTGGGYEVAGKNPGAVTVYVSRPNGASSWHVQAKRTVNISKTWGLSAFAICATGTEPPASPTASPTASPSASPSGTGTGAGTVN